MEKNIFYLLLGLLPTIFGGLSFFIGKLLYTYSYLKEGKSELYLLGGFFTITMIFVPFIFGFFTVAEKFGIWNYKNDSVQLVEFAFSTVGILIALLIIWRLFPILEEKKEPLTIIKHEGFEYYDSRDSEIKLFVFLSGVYLILDMLFSGYSLRANDYGFIIATLLMGVMYITIFPILVSGLSAYNPYVTIYLKNGISIYGYLLKIDETFIEMLGVAKYTDNEVIEFLKKHTAFKDDAPLIPARYFVNVNEIDFFLIPEKSTTITRIEQLIKFLKPLRKSNENYQERNKNA